MLVLLISLIAADPVCHQWWDFPLEDHRKVGSLGSTVSFSQQRRVTNGWKEVIYYAGIAPANQDQKKNQKKSITLNVFWTFGDFLDLLFLLNNHSSNCTDEGLMVLILLYVHVALYSGVSYEASFRTLIDSVMNEWSNCSTIAIRYKFHLNHLRLSFCSHSVICYPLFAYA